MSEQPALTLGALRGIRNLVAPYPKEATFTVHIHPDMVETALNLPNFTPLNRYLDREPVSDTEVGVIENFRFRTAPELSEGAWCAVEDE